MSSSVLENDEAIRREKDFFQYVWTNQEVSIPSLTQHRSAVLNLPISATETEVKDRYRALSLAFHPDRQHDEQLKETAKKKFLEIQAAYEGSFILFYYLQF